MSKVMFQAKVTNKQNHTHLGLFVNRLKPTRCDLPHELHNDTDIKKINGIVGNDMRQFWLCINSAIFAHNHT